MSNSPHRFTCKVNSLCRLFSKVVSFDHHHQEGNIEEGWEYIEVLDRELGNEKEHHMEDIEMGDQGDANILSFPTSEHPNYVMRKYKILSKAEVRQRLEDKMTKVCTVLSLPRNEAAIILQQFKWSVSRTTEEWLTCEEKVRKAVGLYVRPVVEIPADTTEIACSICHEDFAGDFPYSVSCGHQSCRSCWEGYIREAINDGPQCLTLRCPVPTCDAAVGLYFIEQLLSLELDKMKFENHLLRTYTAQRRKAKWCPAPDCNYVVFSSNSGESNVTCRCSNCFCWSCSREGHAPVDCATFTEWMSERSRQSENWMLANTIPCPMCKTKFEQTSCSFLYAECDLCRYKFCSTCGHDWFNHEFLGQWSHKCNPIPNNYLRMSAKDLLERYNHYYQEWVTCESSRENTLVDLKLFQDLKLELLCAIFDLSPEHLGFVVEAIQQIAEGWQLLKWMHVYGYYFANNEHAKMHLFEFMQEEARNLVGRLHSHVEQIQDFLYCEAQFEQFVDFRNKIIMLTRVLRNYFDQLMDALMSGLSEVVCIPELSPRLKMWQQHGENSCSLESPENNVMCLNSSLNSDVMRD